MAMAASQMLIEQSKPIFTWRVSIINIDFVSYNIFVLTSNTDTNNISYMIQFVKKRETIFIHLPENKRVQ